MDPQHLRTDEAVWIGQRWRAMFLSCVQHFRNLLQPRVWESDRVSVCLNRWIWTTGWSTDHRRPLCRWHISHTWISWNKATHLWSFAAGIQDTVHSTTPSASCPCVNGTAAPSYVGNDYFCESGNPGPSWTRILYANAPLWDGQGCGFPQSCCEYFSLARAGAGAWDRNEARVTAPWFCKQLPQATSDDIEVCICLDQDSRDEDVQIELIELYIR